MLAPRARGARDLLGERADELPHPRVQRTRPADACELAEHELGPGAREFLARGTHEAAVDRGSQRGRAGGARRPLRRDERRVVRLVPRAPPAQRHPDLLAERPQPADEGAVPGQARLGDRAGARLGPRPLATLRRRRGPPGDAVDRHHDLPPAAGGAPCLADGLEVRPEPRVRGAGRPAAPASVLTEAEVGGAPRIGLKLGPVDHEPVAVGPQGRQRVAEGAEGARRGTGREEVHVGLRQPDLQRAPGGGGRRCALGAGRARGPGRRRADGRHPDGRHALLRAPGEEQGGPRAEQQAGRGHRPRLPKGG